MIRRKFYTFAVDKAKIKLKIEDSSYAVSDKTFFEHKDTKLLSPKAKYKEVNISVGKISCTHA